MSHNYNEQLTEAQVPKMEAPKRGKSGMFTPKESSLPKIFQIGSRAFELSNVEQWIWVYATLSEG